MTWRITGTELLDADELVARSRRRADISWDDGLVIEPRSEWVIDKLRVLDGLVIGLQPTGGMPTFTVDLGDRASTYWAVMSLLYEFVEISGDVPDPVSVDETPEVAVN